ncbi:hypothetical protein [Plantibacter sp. CFBP 8804]|uniref:hypothetical protein n=1 Tax=Plantibacter sp. CFBP 8804 TaxID=2775270 RepID=UPI00177C760C|nr:hypothetical protein [Plantibacter sp. CFBP 8804]MBD8517857.1 hypothetical protein [Plantibacter sp. CFBP 8804]
MPDEPQDNALESEELESPELENETGGSHTSSGAGSDVLVSSQAGSLANQILASNASAGFQGLVPKFSFPVPDIRDIMPRTSLLGSHLSGLVNPLNPPVPKLEGLIPPLNFPTVKLEGLVPKFALTPPPIAMFSGVSAFSGLSGAVSPFAPASSRAFELISASLQSALSPLFPQMPADFLEQLLAANNRILRAQPPNWWEVAMPKDLAVALALAVDEGLPLAWVPRPTTLDALLEAETPAARRRVFANRWRSVVSDCEEHLDAIGPGVWSPYVEFARKAVRGIRDGHHELAQAMSVSLMDSVMKRKFSERGAKRMMDQNRRPVKIDRFAVRSAIVFGGIWGIHGHYRPGVTASIPRSLNRNASVHGVSKRQYTRVNSVLALGHVTSLLRLIDDEAQAE